MTERPLPEEKISVNIDEDNVSINLTVEPDQFCINKFKEAIKGLSLRDGVVDDDISNAADSIYNCIFKDKIPEPDLTPKQLQNQLESLEKTLKKLSETLCGLHTETKDTLIYRNYGVNPLPDISALETCRQLAKDSKKIIAQDIESNRGRKRDPLLAHYCRELDQIYQILTGKKPTAYYDNYDQKWKGEFYNFVVLIFNVADIQYSQENFARIVARNKPDQ